MKINDLTIGVNFVKCSECEHRKIEPSIRDDFLVTAGRRAAYMDDAHIIELPAGIENEHRVAMSIVNLVNTFLETRPDEPFDLFIESALHMKYGKGVLK